MPGGRRKAGEWILSTDPVKGTPSGSRLASLADPALLAFGVVLLDQFTKILIDAALFPGAAISLINGYLRLVYVRNAGGAFGLLRDSGTPFVFVSIAASALVLLYLFLMPTQRILGRRALALILGGAVGNMIDRLLRGGEVIDFIDVGLSPGLRWPSFNVADIAVTVGVALLVVEFVWDGRRKQPREEKPSA